MNCNVWRVAPLFEWDCDALCFFASGYILTDLLTCVQAALTYAEAQMRIDDQSMNDDVTLGLRRLNDLAKILKQRRQQNGSVDGWSIASEKNVELESIHCKHFKGSQSSLLK